MTRAEREQLFENLSTQIRSECRRMAEQLRTQRQEIRENKVLIARMRVSNGYYDSDLVIRAISNSLLPIINHLNPC